MDHDENRKIWLVDRWDERDVSHLQNEKEINAGLKPSVYIKTFEQVQDIFSGYEDCEFIQGTVPDCLDRIKSDKISFVYTDLNVAQPEIDAAEYLWERMVSGGIYMIDDYGMFPETRRSFDDFAQGKNLKVLSTAVGVGIIVKP